MIPTRRVLHRLLYDALIEIRAKGNASNDKAVFSLADLFHNVPMDLDKLDRGEVSVEDIMHKLEEHARRRGIEGWLDLRLKEIVKYHPETMENRDTSP